MVGKIGRLTIIFLHLIVIFLIWFLLKTVFLLTALHFFAVEAVIFGDFALCDRQITLYPGQSRSLRSPYYPSGYMPGSSCRYNIQAPIDYQIQLTCNIHLTDVWIFIEEKKFDCLNCLNILFSSSAVPGWKLYIRKDVHQWRWKSRHLLHSAYLWRNYSF